MPKTKTQTIECPHCGEPAVIGADNPYRPFCSRRCKLVDLGDWLDESNRIPGPQGSMPGMGEDDDPGLPH